MYYQKMKTLSVLVPIFNEQRSIKKLVDSLKKLQPEQKFEFIFVDDGSTDESIKILESDLFNSGLKFKIVTKVNQGKSSAVREGIKLATGTHTVILDSDMELDPREILKLWDIVLRGQSEYVIGYRVFFSQSSFTYRYAKGNKIISNIYGILYNVLITDVMCGFKLMPTKLIQDLNFKYRSFAIEIEILLALWKMNQKPYEVEVSYSPRTREQGKTISIKDAGYILYVMIINRLKYNS
jgi:glycosyltransferase involved in cell wall biosynthesis